MRKLSVFLWMLLCFAQPLMAIEQSTRIYEVQAGDNLWTIAKQLQKTEAYEKVSLEQLVLAFLQLNPKAFSYSCNYHSLQQGKRLRLPEISKVLEKNQATSRRLLKQQTQQWNAFRQQQQPIICNLSSLAEETENLSNNIKAEKTDSPPQIPEKLRFTLSAETLGILLFDNDINPSPPWAIDSSARQPIAPPSPVIQIETFASTAVQNDEQAASPKVLPTASFEEKVLAIFLLLSLISVFVIKDLYTKKIASLDSQAPAFAKPSTINNKHNHLSDNSLNDFQELDLLQVMQGTFTNAMIIKISGIVLLVLVAAQGFNSSLSIASFEKLYLNALTSNYQALGRNLQYKLENAIRFGKPLTSFVGLEEFSNELKKINSDIDNIAIALPNRKIVYSLQPQFKGQFLSESLVINTHKAIEAQKIHDRYHLVLPLQTRDTLQGVIDLSFKQSLVNARVNAITMDNLKQLALTILIAACVLLVGLYILLATRRFALSKRKLYLFLLIVLGSAQLFYSSYNIEFFQKNYAELVQGKVQTLSKVLQSDLNAFLKVINLNRLLKVDVLMGRVAKAAPEIESIQISNLENKPLYQTDQLKFSNLQTQQAQQSALSTKNTPYQIVLPLQDETQRVGYLTVKISQKVLQQKIDEIVLDSVTVVIISFLFLTELMIFLLIFINRQILSVHQPQLQTRSDIYRVARPATFIYIFSAMLCYSFLPLYVEQIYQPVFGLAKNFVLGLPLSAEIFFAGLTLIPAGILIDKKGWYRGFLMGISLSLLGTLLSGFAHNPVEFIMYRGIVGVGYAFCWMSLQGFVINSTDEDNRAQGITYLIAAVFSGTICGSAIGGMLAQHVGFAVVFFIAVIIMVLSLIFIMLFMRQHAFHTDITIQARDQFIWTDLWKFLKDRNVLVMFSCSLIPFSVAMVGIIYYAGPIYLSQIGTSQSNIGRVIMVFGLCVIYLAPIMSRLIDKAPNKKHYISISGLVGALGLVIFQVPLGFWNVFFAILLLGISSSLGASSRNIFILNLPISKSFGVTKVMGIYRSVDKLGQTLGPIFLGALAVVLGGIEAAIVASGIIYLLLTLIFIFGVPKETNL